MVGGVLEAKRRWDIAKKVINSISKEYPGVLPVWPKVSLFFTLYCISYCNFGFRFILTFQAIVNSFTN